MLPVDVIVPVYSNLDITRVCLQSVLQYSSEAASVIVVDDASPEPEVSAYCDELAQAGLIRLLRNESNLGFVGSVNRAMKINAGHDVILLNSDTRVPPDWLSRLQRSAYMAETVATATPFSNDATICSYPVFCQSNALPAGLGAEALDQLFQQANAGVSLPLPTAVGFCMFIKRECLNQVGYFDEERFGKGYGEESDFSMRASAAGWSHHLCCDLFVYHEGSVSFGAERDLRVVQAEKIIQALHPEYASLVSEFVLSDPVRLFRDRVDHLRANNSDQVPLILAERAQYRDALLAFSASLQLELNNHKREITDFQQAVEQYQQVVESLRTDFEKTDNALQDAQRIVYEKQAALDQLNASWPVRFSRLLNKLKRFR